MDSTTPVVAVLYQALPPPRYGGVSKPPKPGGYRDSGADVAYTLSRSGITVLTPEPEPDPTNQDQWCFPDTEEGILAAVKAGATHLWANTVLFAEHPLQVSSRLTPHQERVRVVGQPPLCADQFDDKSFVNDCLRRHGGLTLPRSWVIDDPRSGMDDSVAVQRTSGHVLDVIHASDFPIVAKPVRGRGSHGVKVCHNAAELSAHVARLFEESPRVLLEEYLNGEEGTITVMPPSQHAIPGEEPSDRFTRHWALPPVTRFNHVDGVAPYSGKVAVTVNSRAVTTEEVDADPAYTTIMRECETVAGLLQTRAPLRIDIRRFGPRSRFALFDINMKPNITGPGRPGRDDQTSLMGLAAESMGWGYPTFLQYVLGSAPHLGELRNYSPLIG
ncbi:glutathione synthetase ATP-binding domain-like protein [Penicillium canariense]|uniref:Glutathione synthetase ATP-binding domain-like protein n=1 Tax=Penicillium canariense TaxID=189055 RepID=A0A9W9I7T6_9EURO|nr:glutathione synthetase ATP-binding domain-like protein [Penicillium canariense]KAJ5168408.1 glutathione synthetase ATP-binding domain-like protein [Penicillium canariense]